MQDVNPCYNPAFNGCSDMSHLDETVSIKGTIILIVSCLAVLPSIALWLLTNDLLAGIGWFASTLVMVGGIFLLNRFLPKGAVKDSRLRSWLTALILAAVVLPGPVFSLYPISWRGYIDLVGLIVMIAVIFLPLPKRHGRNSTPADSLHTSQ
jgi:hypothetical protein